jgi:hypothetical protein
MSFISGQAVTFGSIENTSAQVSSTTTPAVKEGLKSFGTVAVNIPSAHVNKGVKSIPSRSSVLTSGASLSTTSTTASSSTTSSTTTSLPTVATSGFYILLMCGRRNTVLSRLTPSNGYTTRERVRSKQGIKSDPTCLIIVLKTRFQRPRCITNN